MSTNISAVLAEKLKEAESHATRLEAEIQSLRSALKAQGAAPPAASSLLESITDAFVALDRECRYIWVNGEAERLMGVPREEVIGKTIRDVFPGVMGTALEAHCGAALSEQRTVEFENYYPPFDRWFRNKAYPTKEGGLAIYWRDITEQKRSQEKLKRQALILSQVHDSIIITDLEGIVQDWNQGAERITGYAAEEAVGKSVSLLYFEEERSSLAAQVLDPVRQLGQLEVETRNRHRSGGEIYLRLSLSLLRDEAGEPCGIVGVATDITEQKRADKALRESEKRYRSLANAMPQIAYTTGPEGRTEFVNQHWHRFSGMTPESCRDFDWMNWVHPDDAGGLMALWMDSVARGEPFQAEYRLRGRDGEYRWQLGRALPVRDGASERVAHWAGTVTDIHDRKAAEEALARSEERFRLAVLAFEGVVYDWNVSANFVERIGDVTALTGTSAEPGDASPEGWARRIHPDDRERVIAAAEAMVSTGGNTMEVEYRLQHADRGWIHVCDRGYAVRSEDGKLLRVVGSTCDVTARTELELELKSTNERLARHTRVFDIIKDPVIAIDANGCVTYCNAAAERIYGVRQPEIAGRPLSAMVVYRWLKPEDEGRAYSELRSRGAWSGENIHVLNNGSELIVNSSVNVLPRELGGGMVAVIRDVSARKAAELELEKRATQLTRANRDLLHFAYAVSHDLQTPLRTICSFSQLLALSHRKPGTQADDYINWITGAANRMSTMLRDLVKFAQAAGGEIDPNQEGDLEAALSDALKNLRGQIEESKAVVEHDAMPTVRGDAGQLSALFQNLIGNALKYRKANVAPAIRISAERKGDAWEISVRDNGIGFEPQFAERIFGVFQRLHKDEYTGTGVGLAICQRIVERMGGRIRAEGQAGEGAVFTFSIPAGADRCDVRDEVSSGPRVAETPSMGNPPVSERAFDELFQILDLAPAVVRRLDGTITVWTASSERIFGWSQSEALGADEDELLGTEYPVPQQEIEATLLREGRWSGELKKRRKDGRSVWFASHWLLHRDGSGRPESVVEVYNDITELKSAERDLKLTLERMEAAIEATPVVVFTQDLDLRYTWIYNPALGYSPDEVIGSSDFDLFERAEDAERLIAIKRAVIEAGAPRREAVQILDSGVLKWFDLNVKPQMENGAVVGVLCTAIDITDRAGFRPSGG